MVEGDKLMTDSRCIAKHFGKQHRNVLRDISKVECSKEFAERNFAFSYEINSLRR